MDAATAINNWVFNGDMEGIQQVVAQFERPAEEVDGEGAAAPEPVDDGGAAAPESEAEEADGGGEEAETEEEDVDCDPMHNIYKMLHDRVEVDGESRTCCIEYLTLETAKAIMAEFEKPGACYDDEGAHSNEDAINAAFIRGVALRKYTLEEAQEIAQLISGIGLMGFARWCA